uniref:Uncharacterized protein n=1 Tax=Rhizophora mucronata TaxID=61149 RepID=A0A2P2NK69_RHIMU
MDWQTGLKDPTISYTMRFVSRLLVLKCASAFHGHHQQANTYSSQLNP